MKRFLKFVRNTFLGIMIATAAVMVISGAVDKVKELVTDEPTIPDPPSEDTHIYLANICQGSCRELVGEVTVTVVFVDDAESKWTAEAQNEAKKSLIDQESALEAAAKSYGAELNIEYTYLNATVDAAIPISPEDDTWRDKAIESAGLSPFSSAADKLKKKYGSDEAPIVFAINKDGRSNAHQQYYNTTEYCTVFKSDLSAFSHELLHLFGAMDFYYPATVTLLCETHLGDSIMNTGKEIDPLTAHLVGWTDDISDGAQSFLDGSKIITQATLDREHEKETFTGNGTRTSSLGTYTGDMIYGRADGNGKFVYNSGDVYEGEWKNNRMHGKGTYTFADGSYYEGEWSDGDHHGTGKYVWANGDTFEGTWENGVRTGNGKLTYADGSYYEGEWANNAQNGHGKLVWASGSSYEGTWSDGQQHGQGRYTSTEGKVTTGTWENGKFVR